jgi:hypothetical protein
VKKQFLSISIVTVSAIRVYGSTVIADPNRTIAISMLRINPSSARDLILRSFRICGRFCPTTFGE